jgi:hypothetical protein
MLVFPIIVSIGLAFACFIQIAASPRVLSRFSFRLIALAGLGLFIAAAVKTAPDILDSPKGLWYSLRWLATCVPFAICLRLMHKMEKERDDVPEKMTVWSKESRALHK